MLNVSALAKAVHSLAVALEQHKNDPEDTLRRDGCIQRFEYTYELSHKMLRRFLQATEPNPDVVEAMTFQTLVRTGFERGLVEHSWDTWRDWRDKRGTTSHTYDEDKAMAVFAGIPAFLREAQYLLAQLQSRLKSP